ncbi:MAG: HEAT repeat domain-containing protein [Actinomycetota bacterium]|nr:HEAT repeat domain-containing protein [Actinomycetota bacterium]
MVDDPDERVRAAAVRALGRIRAVGAVEALRPTLNDDKRWVRRRAREALIEIGTSEAVAALGGNLRRLSVLRALDVRAARRSVARHERRAKGDVARSLDSLTVRLGAGALKAIVFAAVVLAVDVGVVGAPPTVIAVVAVAIGAPLAWLMVAVGEPAIDLGIHRLERRPEDSIRASLWRTLGRTFARRPLSTVALAAVPIALDALTGATGIPTGIVVAFALAAAASRALETATASVHADELGGPMLVEPDPDGLRRGRFFRP